MRIVYLEDEEPIRNMYKRLFEFHGHEFYAVSTRKAAAFLVETKKPQVLVTDQDLEGEGLGSDFVEEVKLKFPDLRCVILTSNPYQVPKGHRADVVAWKGGRYQELIELLAP